MDRQVFKKNILVSAITGLGPLVFTLIVVALVLAGLKQAEEANRVEGVRLLQETLLRGAIHSYAIEGHFPQSLSHLTENYGIYIDTTRFVVHYEVFAANLLPDIRVIELNRR